MQDPYEVLALKEEEVSRLRRETEALRLVIALLEQGTLAGEESGVEQGAASKLLVFGAGRTTRRCPEAMPIVWASSRRRQS